MKKVTVVLGVLLTFSGFLFAQNLIGNSSFEDISPSFWNPVNGTWGTELGVGTDAADVHTAYRSFKITKSAATSDIVGWQSDDNANKYWNNAGAGTFALTAYVKTVGVNTSPTSDDAKIGIKYEFKNAAGTELAAQTLWADQTAADVDWAHLEGVVILSEAPEQVFVTLFMGKDATGTVYFDDVDCNTSDTWTMGVFNGGAEDVAGWMDWYAANGSWALVTDNQAHTGSYSVELSQPSTVSELNELVYYSQPYPVEAGEWYQIGVWVKTEGVKDSSDYEPTYITRDYHEEWVNLCYFFHGDENIETAWDNLPGGDKFVYIDQRDPSTGWTHYTVAEQAPEEATGISVRARFNNQVTGTAWFDDFSVEKMIIPTTGIEPKPDQAAKLPKKYILVQNYPNPFNPETTIEYRLPSQSKVTLVIYNVLGQQIRTLTNTVQNAGTHQIIWDARDDRGELQPTGVYLYVLSTNERHITKKMVLMR
jgi:hypothetical protein